MISVKAVYHKAKYLEQDIYIFVKLQVTGHADGTTRDGIKCCAGVSSVLLGIVPFVDRKHDEVKIGRGEFVYLYNYAHRFINQINYFTHIRLMLILQQLYEIYKIYPHYFAKFELDERKE